MNRERGSQDCLKDQRAFGLKISACRDIEKNKSFLLYFNEKLEKVYQKKALKSR